MAKRNQPATPMLPGFEPEAEPTTPAKPAPTRAAPTPTEATAAIAAMLQPSGRPPGPQPESLAGQTVWVIDAHSLIHQVFHALPEMTSPDGQPVAAVYGFTRDLLYLLEAKRPDFLFCAFDMPGKTFRHAMYDQYKANRPAMPDDLAPQIIPAIGLSRRWGFRLSACRRSRRTTFWPRSPGSSSNSTDIASSSPATRIADS